MKQNLSGCPPDESLWLSRRGVLRLLVMCLLFLVWGGFSYGCARYSDRVIFTLKEDASFPCLGVVRWELSVKNESGEIAFRESTSAAGSNPSQLFWSMQTKRCQLPDNISFKSALEFGGRKQMELVGFDSANERVAFGTSSPVDFIAQQAAGGVSGLFIDVNLRRVQGLSRGTLLLRWAALPPGTNNLQVVLLPVTAQNLQQRVIPITLNAQAATSFVAITGMQSAVGRRFKVNALNNQTLIKTSREQSFSIKQSVSTDMVSAASLVF